MPVEGVIVCLCVSVSVEHTRMMRGAGRSQDTCDEREEQGLQGVWIKEES